MDFSSLIFWLLAFIVVVFALGVVFLRNILHSALALIVVFIGASGLYLTLHSEFLAAIQILIYAGAISILIVFGIMLITKGNGRMETTNLFGKRIFTSGILILLLLSFISFSILSTSWQIKAKPAEYLLEDLAGLIFHNHVIAFELAGVLLTAAMVGAILIAGGGKKNG